MNVKELIEKLKKYDESAEVYIGRFYDQYHFCIGRVDNMMLDEKESVFLHEGKQVWVKSKKEIS